MRRMLSFANRTMKEILRDPLTMAFGLGFPVVLLLLLSLIQANIPVEMFELTHLTPGITVFGLSFMTLFSAQLISKDRTSSLLTRLYTTPLKATDFILGYLLPVIPLCIAQAVICYILALILGLQFTVNIIWAILMIFVPSFFYVALGLLCGSALTEKQVGGICGALLTNLSAWLSGIWFDINMLGKAVKTFANALPFIHAVELERAMVLGDINAALPHLWWVLGYGIVLMVIAVLVFLRQMKRQ
ncbi:MAG: ABC transporter permease [Spirochaetales bacterium]|nr:ABC transporter permease [Spirochaetales bacterium]